MYRIIKRTVGLVLLILSMSLIINLSGWAGETCYVCGVDLGKSSSTKFVINTRDKRHIEVCSFYCAMKIIEGEKRVKNILAIDYDSGKQIDAQTATYVLGSAIKGSVHNNSWLAFMNENSTTTFILRNGGTRRNFNEAKRIAVARLNNKSQIPSLLKSQTISAGCLKCHTEKATRKAY